MGRVRPATQSSATPGPRLCPPGPATRQCSALPSSRTRGNGAHLRVDINAARRTPPASGRTGRHCARCAA